MIAVDIHDVVPLGNRPIGSEQTVFAVMHRVFFAKSLKEGPPGVVLQQRRIADIDVFQGDAICIGDVRCVDLPSFFHVGLPVGVDGTNPAD